MQRQVPDPFFSDPADRWDPFREMRSLQAEMNQMFRQSIARFHASPLMNPFGDDAGSTNVPSVGSEWGRYTQVVELAGNLKSERMKVQQKDHELVITIPKA